MIKYIIYILVGILILCIGSSISSCVQSNNTVYQVQQSPVPTFKPIEINTQTSTITSGSSTYSKFDTSSTSSNLITTTTDYTLPTTFDSTYVPTDVPTSTYVPTSTIMFTSTPVSTITPTL